MAGLALRERMAALARSEHERAARSLPAAALPQRAFSENTTKRDIPTFVRARIREFEAARECVVILAACLGVLFFESRRSSRWRGERADSHETHKKITKTKNTGREVVAHDARRERRLGLGHPLLLPAARPGGGLVRGGRKAQLREAGLRPAAHGRARGRARRRARVPRRAPRGAAGREGRPDDVGNLAVAPRVHLSRRWRRERPTVL